MAVVTGSGRTNVSDIIDAVRDDLVTNRGWTQRRNTGTVGGANKEVWLERPAGNTFNGQMILIGMKQNGADLLEMQMSHAADWNTASATDTLAWGSFVLDIPPASGGWITNNPTDRFNTGANYLSHWILTPSNTGASPGMEQYCYVVVEVSAGLYRTFGFGECKKLGTWTGGPFIMPSFFFTGGTTNDGRHGFFADGQFSPATDAIHRSGWVHCALASTTEKWVRLGSITSTTNPATHGSWSLGQRGEMPGTVLHDRAPAPFSGQSVRWPSRFYYGDTIANDPNLRPFLEIPDVFQCNIRDLGVGTVVLDDAEKFLVVPMASKGGSLNTGNYGFLIRNPGL